MTIGANKSQLGAINSYKASVLNSLLRYEIY